MMDLEDRLRGTFAGLADEVEPSANPRAELERRLATRRADRWRMPALVAAAVVTPVVLFQGDGGVGAADQTASADQNEPGASDGLDPPVVIRIGTFTKDGKTWDAFVRQEEKQVCAHAVATDGSESTEPVCTQVPTWPQPPADSLVLAGVPVLSEGLPDTGPLPHLLMFLTAPQVATLDVRDGPGEPVAVTKLGVTDTGTLWLADFGGSTQGFGYDAKDAAGNYIDGGIT